MGVNNELQSCLSSTLNVKNKKRTESRIITVTSGKGGVGKTNFTINLAILLMQMKKKVIVIDADLGLANIDVILGITPKYDLNNVLEGDKKITEVITEGPCGLKFIAGGTIAKKIIALEKIQMERFAEGLKQLGEYAEIILIDTGAGISQNVLSFVLASNEVIVVTTPEPTAIADAYGIVKVISINNNKAQIKLVVNSAKHTYEAEQTAKKLRIIAQTFLNLEIDYLGHIFKDECVTRAVRKQQPFVITYPYSEARLCIENIAKKVSNNVSQPDEEDIDIFLSRMNDMLK